MNRKKAWVSALILVSALVASRYFTRFFMIEALAPEPARALESRLHPIPSSAPSSRPQTVSASKIGSQEKSPVTDQSEVSEAEAEKIFESAIHLPRIEDLREDVASNPHETPRALLLLGAELGVRLRIALRSEPEAKTFIKQLRDCATGIANELSPPPVQALCLVHAQPVVRKFPELKAEYAELNTLARPEARMILSWLDHSE
jgi:hypothetical protein